MTKLTALLAASALLVAAPAFAANTTAPAKTAPVAAAKAKGPAKTEAKTPEGKACSAQADAQNLHGAARKAFRSKCKDTAKSQEKSEGVPVAAANKTAKKS